MRRLGLILILFLASCRGLTAPQEGPIVLITFDSLRADVVGGLGGERGLTPSFDALLRQADWGGRAIAPSSLGSSAMASLLTGLRPWQHQVLRDGDRLSRALLPLSEALQRLGYETNGFTGEPAYGKDGGYDQGFDRLEDLNKGIAASQRLERIGSGRRFVWIHIPEPAAPYIHRPRFDDRIDTGRLQLPDRIQPNELALYLDPANPLPPARRRLFWTMYRFNVAWADDRLGRLIQALRSSGEWDRTLLVVTSTHGEELGEKGQILNGGNLGRQLLEVPFAIKLPLGFRLKIAEPRERRIAAARLWATLVEAAGGDVPPAVAPSLFHHDPAPVLSELYGLNGVSQLSLVDGDDQLLWESRFAPPEPDYYLARLAMMGRGNAEIARAELKVPPKTILDRLRAEFLAVPPLSGTGPPRLALERWEADGGERPFQDPRRTAELARALARTWNAFIPAERPPGEEAREWYTAESP
ncbi:MAG TPA: sulfatase-like hydrolase/transferase [Thermoanaerobaculia bacterium]|nr:sulfatase-like hydrolase/transferase [Thermoanaerobaculia bacterium]